MTRVLILTTAFNYTHKEVAPFWASLRHVGFKGRLTVLTDPAGKKSINTAYPGRMQFIVHEKEDMQACINAALDAIKTIAHSGVNFVSPEVMGQILAIDFNWTARFMASLAHPSVFRYGLYHAYLSAVRDKFDTVLLCDCRDVWFQRNPEDVLPDNVPLTFGLESAQTTLGSEPYNTRWIQRLYGDEGVMRYTGKRVSCSGITYGSTDVILDYLEKLTRELAVNFIRIGAEFGFDQGVHNRLWWDNMLPGVVLNENFYSDVINISGEDEEGMYAQIRGNYLCRKDNGEPIMLLHQYDRPQKLVEYMGRQL